MREACQYFTAILHDLRLQPRWRLEVRSPPRVDIEAVRFLADCFKRLRGLSAPRSPARRPLRCRDTGQCSPTFRGRAIIGRRGDCPSSCRSTPPLSVEGCGCRRRPDSGRSFGPKRRPGEHTVEYRCALRLGYGWEIANRHADAHGALAIAPMPPLAASVISKGTGRPVFCWMIVER